MENKYIEAINKLDELEDEKVLEAIANHFKSKAECIKECKKMLEELEDISCHL